MWKLFMFVQLISFNIFAYQQIKTDAQHIKVYNRNFHNGDEEWVDISKCSNLSPNMMRQVVSVHTMDNCARLYAEEGCKGESIEVMRRSPSHSDLGNGWNFDKKTASAGPCRDPCDIEVTGEMMPGRIYEIMISNMPDFNIEETGKRLKLVVQGCTLFPPDFIDNVKAVDTRGVCFQLYNNDNCQTEGDQIDSIELRNGTPFHGNIRGEWIFTGARSVSHCDYKCLPGARIEKTTTFATTPASNSYDERYFGNNSQVIQVYNLENFTDGSELVDVSKCSNLQRYIDTLRLSVKTGGICARLYTEWNCTGDSIELYPRSPSHNSLADWKLNGRIESAGPCRDPCDIDVIGNTSPGETSDLVLLSQPAFQGETAVIAVQGCTIVPQEFVSRTESVITNGTCFRLYNNYNCQTEGEGMDSIELRKGSPGHGHIAYGWGFPEVRAVSHCQYNCKSSGRLEGNIYPSTTSNYYTTDNYGTDYYGTAKDYYVTTEEYSPTTPMSPTVYNANATLNNANRTLHVTVDLANPITG